MSVLQDLAASRLKVTEAATLMALAAARCLSVSLSRGLSSGRAELRRRLGVARRTPACGTPPAAKQRQDHLRQIHDDCCRE
jgi:hypothetical protein